ESGSRGRPAVKTGPAPSVAAPRARTKTRRCKVQLLDLIATPSSASIDLGQNAVPAFAVRTPDELVGFRRIPGAQADVVPLELLPSPVGHVAKVVRLGNPT